MSIQPSPIHSQSQVPEDPARNLDRLLSGYCARRTALEAVFRASSGHRDALPEALKDFTIAREKVFRAAGQEAGKAIPLDFLVRWGKDSRGNAISSSMVNGFE